MIRLESDTARKCLKVLKRLQEAGYEAFIVGGAVRDLLLDLPVSDFDIASSAHPNEVVNLFEKVIPTGVKHGTVTVIFEDESFEVTTFRSEKKYDDFRHPSEVTFLNRIDEDLARRDFTINSMALSSNGEIVDPYQGRDDLKSGIIRTVGHPDERFTEDPLRMLRALRFLSVFSFQFEEETFQAIKKNASLLSQIAVERVTAEFNKLLAGSGVEQAMQRILETGVYVYLPGLPQMKAYLEIGMKVSFLKTDEERWAWLAFEKEDPVFFLKKWRLSNDFIKKVQKILSVSRTVQMDGWNRDTVYAALPFERESERVLAVMNNRIPTYEHIDNIASALPITSSDMVAVTGEDLIAWTGQKPGPWVGECLKQIEQAILNEEITNEKSSIKRWLEHWQIQ
ncbi:CCA tRNA nucleotidyltransferase [Alkalihalobacillus sp. R86527]|uniref:CCA tRNA nucleotidyltransferase n=1 Tax=Alkalihalobacillus sp. R86527 TaxID=3093863 RepID=UPI003670D0F6